MTGHIRVQFLNGGNGFGSDEALVVRQKFAPDTMQLDMPVSCQQVQRGQAIGENSEPFLVQVRNDFERGGAAV